MAERFTSILLLFSIISQGVLSYESKKLRQYRIEFQNMIIREYHDFAPYYLNEIKKIYMHRKLEYFSKIETVKSSLKKLT